MLPGCKPCIAPFCPHSTSSSAGGSLTMDSTNSQLAASSRGDGASFAPPATSSLARDAVRFQTVNGNPAFNKFMPMGLPISPRPISPTFVCGPITEFTKTSALSKSISCDYVHTANSIVAYSIFPRGKDAVRESRNEELRNERNVKCWIAEVAEKPRKLLSGRTRIVPAARFLVPSLHRRAEGFLPRLAERREISVARWILRVPVSPPNAQYIGKEFPNESAGAGPSVRGSAPGKWSVLYHQQTFRRPVRGYRPRDIGLLPGGREKRSNGPYSYTFELRGYVSNGT